MHSIQVFAKSPLRIRTRRSKEAEPSSRILNPEPQQAKSAPQESLVVSGKNDGYPEAPAAAAHEESSTQAEEQKQPRPGAAMAG